MKVLGLALYGPLAASTRYRLEQYVKGLAEYGIDLEIQYLLNDNYIRCKYSGDTLPWFSMLRSGWQRISILNHQRNFDALILHCELFPLMPSWIEGRLLRKPYIYDFDDAFYLKYQSGRMASLNWLIGKKFDSVIKNASVVTAGNRVLADYAFQENPYTHLLPTVVDTNRYVSKRTNGGRELVVGWIGSPSTSPYLSELVAPLSSLGKEGPVRLVVIGGEAPEISNITVEERAWSEESEISYINEFDIGVMPLPNEPWAQGKCAFKLIQYMACGVPVIASPVGANVDVVQDDCGLLASNDEQWLEALRTLRDRPMQALEMGKAGQERIEKHYSLQRNLPILADVIRSTTRQV